MRRHAKKPQILKDKIKLAYLIRDNWEKLEYNKHISGFYWTGKFKNDAGLIIDIIFQHYIRRLEIDYVDIRFAENCTALTITEIKALLRKFKEKNKYI